MATVASLTVGLRGDGKRLRRALTSSQRDVQRYSRYLRQDLTQAFNRVALATGIATAALAAFARGALRSTDELGKSARRIGTTAEQFQVLATAADLSGLQIDRLTNAITQSTRVIGQAGTNRTYADALDAIGLSAENLIRLDPVSAFNQIVQALQGIPNEIQRLDIAQRIFPEFGRNINNFAVDLEGLERRLGNAGALISGDLVQSVEDLNDQITLVSRTARGAFTQGLFGDITVLTDSELDAFLERVGDAARRAGEGVANLGRLAVENRDVIIGIGAAFVGWQVAMAALSFANIITNMLLLTVAVTQLGFTLVGAAFGGSITLAGAGGLLAALFAVGAGAALAFQGFSRLTETDLDRTTRQVAQLDREIEQLNRSLADPDADPSFRRRAELRLPDLEARRAELAATLPDLEAEFSASSYQGILDGLIAGVQAFIDGGFGSLGEAWREQFGDLAEQFFPPSQRTADPAIGPLGRTADPAIGPPTPFVPPTPDFVGPVQDLASTLGTLVFEAEEGTARLVDARDAIERFYDEQAQAAQNLDDGGVAGRFQDNLRTTLQTALVAGDFSGVGDALVASLQSVLIGDLFDRLAEAINLPGLISGLIPFHEGGIVGGRPGQEVPILAQAGEAVLTPEQFRALAAGGGPSINVTFNVTGDVTQATRRAMFDSGEDLVNIVYSGLRERRVF